MADRSVGLQGDILLTGCRKFNPAGMLSLPGILIVGANQTFSWRLHRQTPQQSALPLRPRLLDQVRDTIRRKHYSLRTERSYIHWIKRFIFFHGKRHPAEMGASQVTAFLNHLAMEGRVAAATQNQALAALPFLYKEVLEIKLPWLEGLTRAKRPQRLPTVLTQAEAKTLLTTLEGTKWLMVTLLYGAGMRLNECLGLWIKDIDFEGRQIFVRDGKGGKDQVTLLPNRAMDPLRVHLERVKRLHEADLSAGLGEAVLPFALARKYPRLVTSGDGSSSFHRRPFARTLIRGARLGITSTKRLCSAPYRRPLVRRESVSPSVVTAFDIRSQPICWKTGSISGRFRT